MLWLILIILIALAVLRLGWQVWWGTISCLARIILDLLILACAIWLIMFIGGCGLVACAMI